MIWVKTMLLCALQPDFAHNLGALIRLGACFGAPVHVVEPCGFPFSLKAVRQAGLDYVGQADLVRHDGWAAFQRDRPPGRLVLLSTQGETALWDFPFAPGDALLLGRETAGAAPEVHAAADARIRAPMRPGARSLNVAAAATLALGEAARQLGWRGEGPLSPSFAPPGGGSA